LNSYASGPLIAASSLLTANWIDVESFVLKNELKVVMVKKFAQERAVFSAS
jgi:hypothetical protein